MALVLDGLLSNDPLARSLRRLLVGTNKLTRPSVGRLTSLLARSQSLLHLGLSRTQLQPEGFESITAAAVGNPSLRSLCLDASENELGERSARVLAQQLDSSCGLIGVKLRSTSLTESGVASLHKLTHTHTHTLSLAHSVTLILTHTLTLTRLLRRRPGTGISLPPLLLPSLKEPCSRRGGEGGRCLPLRAARYGGGGGGPPHSHLARPHRAAH